MKIKYKNYISPTGQVFQESNFNTSDYWDDLWKKYTDQDIQNLKENSESKDDLVTQVSKKYLKKNASIIEAGCGLGQEVFKLENAGFNVTGIDYDENLINRLNNLFPNNTFIQGDVFNLDDTKLKYDGYWSFGVIEHFIDGFDGIASQANKILNNNGYCFVICPSLNILSFMKRKFGMYKKKEINTDLFHQFFLDIKEVKGTFTEQNFEFIEKYHMAGSIGACREISMPNFLKNRSKYKIIRGIWGLLNPILSYLTWHTTLLVFKKL